MTWSRAQTLISCLCVVGLCHMIAALPKCEKIDDCSCKTPDGKEINIRSLGKNDGKSPRFGYEQVPGENWLYAYNPCYPFTKGGECTNAIACQQDAGDPTQTFNIGDGTATWMSDDATHYVIQYSHTDSGLTERTSMVTLVCDTGQETPQLLRLGSLGFQTTFFFTLTSKCACPGGCDSGGGISPGSVLCIIVSVLIIVYVVGGVLFMKFVRHAEGREIVPNYEIWTGLFGNVRDGFIFVFSCGKKSGYDTVK